LLDLLRGLPSDTTLIVSSHLLSDLREVTGQTLTLASGRAVLSGPLIGADYVELHRDYSVRVGGEGDL